MGRSVFETILGAVVLAVAALFIVFANKSADLQKVEGYTVTANFPMVDGLKEGTDVKINGVKVGSVTNMDLLTEAGASQFLVRVALSINPAIKLPTDTMALVATESLLGGKYLSLEPGIDEENIRTDGTGRITRTQAPMRLDDLIGQLIYSQKKGGTDAAPATASPPSVPAAPATATDHP